MRIEIASIHVKDQQHALEFYTETLGFEVKTDAPMGEDRWLTVSSPDGVEGVELLLEPASHPVAKAYQEGLYAAGIPATTFGTNNLEAEVARLTDRGVKFTVPPAKQEWGSFAVFDDTCGNLIGLHQVSS